MKTINITEHLSKHDKITGSNEVEHTIDDLRKILDKLADKYGGKSIIKINIDNNGAYPEVDCYLRYHENYNE